MPPVSPLLDFYRGGHDHRGRRLVEILAWDDARLEDTHDYIQWLFPLPEPSAFQPSAPLLTAADAAAFRRSPELPLEMRAGLQRMLAFYGIEPPGPQSWLTPGDHNLLRLTRILRSLRCCGLEAEAQALFTRLAALHREQAALIGPVTWSFWQRAATAPLPF